jgi:hypothetical protein
VIEATAVAAVAGAAPSTLLAASRNRWQLRPVRDELSAATRAVGTLLPPGRPSFARGALVHIAVSIACGELLAHALPERRAILCGAGAGLAIGVLNVGLIGRRFAAVAALPLLPQLADNAAFGAVCAAVVDR